MKKIFMSAAMLAFLAASCTNEELVQEPMMSGGQPFTLSAEHGMASRTVLDGNQTLWSEGDQIYVSSADGSVYGVLTLKKGAGSDKAEFFGYVSGDPSELAYTIFPAPKSGNVIDLSNRDASNGELDAPMIATFGSDKTSVAFKNETALVKLPVSGLSGGDKVILTGEGIGGSLIPMLSPTTGQYELVYSGAASNTIEIDKASVGNLLIPVATEFNSTNKIDDTPGQVYVQLSVKINEGSETPVGNITLEQGRVSENSVPEIEVSDNGKVNTSVDTEEKLKAALAAGGYVKLAADLEVEDGIIIKNVNVNLDLNGHSIVAANSETIYIQGEVSALVCADQNANVTISNSNDKRGGIYGSKSEDYAVEVRNGGQMTIKSGYFNGVPTAVYALNGVINIEGGHFSVDSTNKYGTTYLLNLYDKAGELSNIIVTGGVFEGYDPSNSDSENPIANFVEPGYFSFACDEEASKYQVIKAGNYAPVFNEDGINKVLNGGGFPVLEADIELTKSIKVANNDIIFDLNGHNITAPITDVFEVTGSLTIEGDDNSVVYAGANAENTASVCAVWARGGTVTINGGYYKVGHDKDGSSTNTANNRNDCIYAGYNETKQGGIIVINGGKFEYVGELDKVNGNKYLVNCADNAEYTAQITVNGGSFKNHVPGSENVTPAGRENKEVILGNGKSAYNGITVVTDAHSGAEDIWYEVK